MNNTPEHSLVDCHCNMHSSSGMQLDTAQEAVKTINQDQVLGWIYVSSYPKVDAVIQPVLDLG